MVCQENCICTYSLKSVQCRLSILKTMIQSILKVMILQLDRCWKAQPRATDLCMKHRSSKENRSRNFLKLRSSRCFLITHSWIKHIHKSMLLFGLILLSKLSSFGNKWMMLACLVVNLTFSRDSVYPTAVIWKSCNVLLWEGKSSRALSTKSKSTHWTWAQLEWVGDNCSYYMNDKYMCCRSITITLTDSACTILLMPVRWHWKHFLRGMDPVSFPGQWLQWLWTQNSGAFAAIASISTVKENFQEWLANVPKDDLSGHL